MKRFRSYQMSRHTLKQNMMQKNIQAILMESDMSNHQEIIERFMIISSIPTNHCFQINKTNKNVKHKLTEN